MPKCAGHNILILEVLARSIANFGVTSIVAASAAAIVVGSKIAIAAIGEVCLD